MSTPEHPQAASQLASNEPASKDPAQIEAEIALHRQELGATVDELTDRLDVKKQAQHQVSALKGRATEQVQDLRVRVQDAERWELGAMAAPVLGVLAGVALLVGAIRWLRG